MTEQKKMAKIVYEALDEKKGYDIKLIDISEITMIKKQKISRSLISMRFP